MERLRHVIPKRKWVKQKICVYVIFRDLVVKKPARGGLSSRDAVNIILKWHDADIDWVDKEALPDWAARVLSLEN